MKRIFLTALTVLLITSPVFAAPYGKYDVKRILVVSDSSSAKRHYGLDLKYLDTMIADLDGHAGTHPPKFNSTEDRQRAETDVRLLAGMFEAITSGPHSNQNLELLIRVARINSIGHNLDIKGSATRADTLFKKALSIAPANPKVTFHYGVFLAGTGKAKSSIPYLKKALSGGNAQAGFSLGMTYLAQGDKPKALQYLKAYKKKAPHDRNVDKIIDSIRGGEKSKAPKNKESKRKRHGTPK